MDVSAIRRAIPCLSRCIYTNTAGFGPMPRAVWDDLRRREEAILEEGLDVLAHDRDWTGQWESWRERLGQVFGADAEEIAIGRALGEGLNMVIAGLDWRPGDEIIITDQEHPTGLLPALNLALARGIRVRVLPVANSDAENLDRFAALLSPSARLVAVSAVTTETGVRLPFSEMCGLAAEREIPVYLDLAQAAGQLPLDLHASGCAFAAASGSKWLLGPLGTAFFYFRRDWLDRLSVAWTGSHTGIIERVESGRMGEWGNGRTGPELPFSHAPTLPLFRFAPGARRFEFGGRHEPLLGAMLAGIEWTAGFGWETIRARSISLATRLKPALGEIPGVTLHTPFAPELSTGIVTFSLAGLANGEVVQLLRDRWRIRSRPTMFNGTRISLAFFNTEEEVDVIAGAVRMLAARE
jgi:selenocysteine lyase/cysteine desulfurase